jgi:indolepyruvate ferredoxin oxidoreductase alpha subunit
MGNFPTLEPSTPQECKDFTVKAFGISRKFQMPVILRTTTMVSHAAGSVKLGTIRKPVTKGRFVKDPDRYLNLRPHLQELHRRLIAKMEGMEKGYASLNRMEGPANASMGVICSGVSYNYVKEAGPEGIRIAKLNMTNPISGKFVSGFLRGLKKVLVVEELEPVIEGFVREVALEANPGVRIHGKDLLTRVGEYTPELVEAAMAKLGVPGTRLISFRRHDNNLAKIKLPKRLPVFCPGCPHSFTYDAVKKVMGKDAIWSGDIGCYSIGIFPPYNMIDWVISMGASAGMAHGLKKVSNQKVVAFMGDSTFFHAGMAGIANIIYNKSNPLIIILDNGITAMTGHQPHPGTGFNATWDKTHPIRIENVLKGLGIRHIKIVDPVNRKEMEAAVRSFRNLKEPAVIISRHMCVLHMKHLKRRGLA